MDALTARELTFPASWRIITVFCVVILLGGLLVGGNPEAFHLPVLAQLAIILLALIARRIEWGLLLTIFLIVGLLFFCLVWIYYDRRDRLYYDHQRQRSIHHCIKCGTLYSSRGNGDPVKCPACGFHNPSLRF